VRYLGLLTALDQDDRLDSSTLIRLSWPCACTISDSPGTILWQAPRAPASDQSSVQPRQAGRYSIGVHLRPTGHSCQSAGLTSSVKLVAYSGGRLHGDKVRECSASVSEKNADHHTKTGFLRSKRGEAANGSTETPRGRQEGLSSSPTDHDVVMNVQLRWTSVALSFLKAEPKSLTVSR
jgi:hypothetical protein